MTLATTAPWATGPPNAHTPSRQAWPSRRACGACDCERFEGEGLFCEFCGHGQSDHSVIVDEFAVACTACSCNSFQGGRLARACGACGHSRAIHSVADEQEPAFEPLSVGRALTAALLASTGGAMIGWALLMLA